VPLVKKHLALGWWWLAVFLALGLGLEVMHGLKAGFYLDVSNETRRLMWTLAHAHGTLLGVLHLAFAFTLRTLDAGEASWARRASLALTIAGVLLPGGFLLGGLIVWGGDPFLGVLLVPLGALALLVAAVSVARRAGAS
jgi:hypothetical protein